MKKFLKLTTSFFILLTLIVAFNGCGKKPEGISGEEPLYEMPDVRSPDITKAIEIPQAPYLVIPNELIILLKEGQTAESFAKTIEDTEIKIVGRIPTFRIMQVEIPSSRREELKAELEKNPIVEAVVYQAVYKPSVKLNDPVFSNDEPWDDWGLLAINAEKAWDITQGSREVTIGVVDTGTLLDHEELKGKTILPGSVFSDDGSQVGDAQYLFHGTHVAIIAGGIGNNGVGTSGVCPGSSVMPVQINLDTGDVFAGLAYAAENGAKVINLSIEPSFREYVIEDYLEIANDPNARLQGATLDSIFREMEQRKEVCDAVFAACEALGVTVVVAAGNSNFPGDFNAWVLNAFTLGVGAASMNAKNELIPADFSNYGYMVRVSAPGVNLYSGTAETGGSGYTYAQGTSGAAPYVAGLAGLIVSINPELTPLEIRQIIIASAYADTIPDSENKPWFKDNRGVIHEMDLWRRAFLLLFGKDENLLLNNIAQQVMLSLIPIEYNTIWRGGEDKAVGRFIDARAALDMAKDGSFRKKFAEFNAEDDERAKQITPKRLFEVYSMLKFANQYAGSDKVSSFTLKIDKSLKRLEVIRAQDPGEGYLEWFGFSTIEKYRHFCRFKDEDYSQGIVEIKQKDGRLSIKTLRTNEEHLYSETLAPGEQSVPSSFYTIAGGNEPNATGKILISYIDPEEKPTEEEFLVYPVGSLPVPENVVFEGLTGNTEGFLTGTYDIKILSYPLAIWFRNVEIKKDETVELSAGGYGKILITASDSDGKPINRYLWMYAPEDTQKESALSRGKTNEIIDAVAGTYDVDISILGIGTPQISYKNIEVKHAQTTEVHLPQLGKLMVSGNNPIGEPLDVSVRVSRNEERDVSVISGKTNKPIEISPGVYYFYANTDPDLTYGDVEIRSGETTEIKLPDWGRLNIQLKNKKGEPIKERYWVYKPEDHENYIATEYTNAPIDLPPGVYDIEVFKRGELIKGVKIEPGKVKVIKLPRL